MAKKSKSTSKKSGASHSSDKRAGGVYSKDDSQRSRNDLEVEERREQQALAKCIDEACLLGLNRECDAQARQERWKIIDDCLAEGALIDPLSIRIGFGAQCSPLGRAVQRGAAWLVIGLLERGANVHAAGMERLGPSMTLSPLVLACANPFPGVILPLLDAGALDAEPEKSGAIAMRGAVEHRLEWLRDELIKRGVPATLTEDGDTLLHLIVRDVLGSCGEAETRQKLDRDVAWIDWVLAQGVDSQALGMDGRTAAQVAIESRFPEYARQIELSRTSLLAKSMDQATDRAWGDISTRSPRRM